jgi:hypothetical protein
VLAPGSNRFHYDHIHVDLMRRASGRAICEPGAVPGEVVAARARGKFVGRGDPGVTGSIASKTSKSERSRWVPLEEAEDEDTAEAMEDDDFPRGGPGED